MIDGHVRTLVYTQGNIDQCFDKANETLGNELASCMLRSLIKALDCFNIDGLRKST